MATKIRFRPESAEGEIDSGAGQIDPNGGRAYKQAEDVAAQSGANAGDAKRSYAQGTTNAKRGKAKVHRGETIVSGTKARRVKKTGVQNLKGHEQIIPAAPQSRWNKVGPTMQEHLARLGLA